MNEFESRKKPKVVVDTNSVNNNGIGNKFFGFRKDLEHIIDKIDLYVPEMVIKEIKEHKRKNFFTKRNELLNNDLFSLSGGSINELNKLNVKEIIENDYRSENIPFHVLKSGDLKDFFVKFEQPLIKNNPPFEKSSDKGIKDAIIAYSIEQLLLKIDPKEKIILVSKDSRLKEYFEQNNRVRSTDNVSGVTNLLEQDKDVPKKINNKNEVDFTGIKEKTNLEKKIEKMLTNLRNAVNFQKTHEFIRTLDNNRQFLTKENKADIIRSALNNNQIKWIITDPDISNFLIPIYYDCSTVLTGQEQAEFEILTGISHIFNPSFDSES